MLYWEMKTSFSKCKHIVWVHVISTLYFRLYISDCKYRWLYISDVVYLPSYVMNENVRRKISKGMFMFLYRMPLYRTLETCATCSSLARLYCTNYEFCGYLAQKRTAREELLREGRSGAVRDCLPTRSTTRISRSAKEETDVKVECNDQRPKTISLTEKLHSDVSNQARKVHCFCSVKLQYIALYDIHWLKYIHV